MWRKDVRRCPPQIQHHNTIRPSRDSIPQSKRPRMAHVAQLFIDRVVKCAQQAGESYYGAVTKDPEFTARLETAVRVAAYIIPGEYCACAITRSLQLTMSFLHYQVEWVSVTRLQNWVR